jgi:hypothetical protein
MDYLMVDLDARLSGDATFRPTMIANADAAIKEENERFFA